MKLKIYMLLRLVIPLIAIILYIFLKDIALVGFIYGYLLCWIFSYITFKKKQEDENVLLGTKEREDLK